MMKMISRSLKLRMIVNARTKTLKLEMRGVAAVTNVKINWGEDQKEGEEIQKRFVTETKAKVKKAGRRIAVVWFLESYL